MCTVKMRYKENYIIHYNVKPFKDDMDTLKAAPLFYLLPLKEATWVTTRVLKVLKSSAKKSASGTLPKNELTRLGL